MAVAALGCADGLAMAFTVFVWAFVGVVGGPMQLGCHAEKAAVLGTAEVSDGSDVLLLCTRVNFALEPSIYCCKVAYHRYVDCGACKQL